MCWLNGSGDKGCNFFDVNGLVKHVNVVLAEQFKVLGRRVCRDDAGRNVVVELFSQFLDVINTVFFVQSEVAEDELQLGKINEEFEKSILLVRNQEDLVALLAEVLRIGLSQRGVILDDANASVMRLRGRYSVSRE